MQVAPFVFSYCVTTHIAPLCSVKYLCEFLRYNSHKRNRLQRSNLESENTKKNGKNTPKVQIA